MNLIFHLPSHPSDTWNLSGGPSSQNTMPQLSACSHLQVCFCDQDFKAICRKLSKSLEAAFPILCLFSKLLFSSSVFSPEFCFCLLHHNFRFSLIHLDNVCFRILYLQEIATHISHSSISVSILYFPVLFECAALAFL